MFVYPDGFGKKPFFGIKKGYPALVYPTGFLLFIKVFVYIGCPPSKRNPTGTGSGLFGT